MCIYPNHQLRYVKFLCFNKMARGSAESCRCASRPALRKSKVTQNRKCSLFFFKAVMTRQHGNKELCSGRSFREKRLKAAVLCSAG